MSEAKPQAAVPERQLRWHQFSLRTLLLGVTIAVVLASLVSTAAWWQNRHPSEDRAWSNDACEQPGSVPHFFASTYSINGQKPTIACFARIDDPTRLATGKDPMPWVKCDHHGQVYVEGRHVPHEAGKLKLFVDDGSGRPTMVILDPADAYRFFDPDCVYLSNYKAFVEFWEKVLKQNYLRKPAT
jgi:hypothetical protein